MVSTMHAGCELILAQKRISEELAKRRFHFHAQKLLQPSALDGNFLQWPREQSVELETGRIGRACQGQIYHCAIQGVKYGISKCFSIALFF
jgi:hypothetical protein